MTTVMLSGLGSLGGWALEFLARTEGVDRIVSIKRTPWNEYSNVALARIGSLFQGHEKDLIHYQMDLGDREGMTHLLADVQPDVIVHSAAERSPRLLMKATLREDVRSRLRAATFSMWLPWHLLPAALLTESIMSAGIKTHVVNTAFPDVVNVSLWNRYGYGPTTGAGNGEICAAQILRYAMDVTGAGRTEIDLSLVGSHALLVVGPRVPHFFRLNVRGHDVTADHDLGRILSGWPEPVDWRRTDVFSIFAASAIKNALLLVGSERIRSHVTSPNGLPGGYPAIIGGGRVVLDLPMGVDEIEALRINQEAARWDGIEEITADGTVVYTPSASEAMASLGYECKSLTFDELPERSDQLASVFDSLIGG